MPRTTLPLPDPAEVEVTAIRAQGAGGQNVNKVATAIHLRFDIRASSLPDDHKARLLALRRAEAFGRLQELVASVAAPPRRRRPTRATAASKQRRLETKGLRSQIKLLRGKVDE